MLKKLPALGLCAMLTLGGVSGCDHSSKTSDYFQTHYQDESQFIVETIATDLAQQVYYAKFHRFPEAKKFSVTAAEAPGSPFGAPVYELHLDLDASHKGMTTRLNVNAPIWSPEVYGDLTAWLAQNVGLPVGANAGSQNTALLAKLTDGQANNIEAENQKISQALAADFTDPSLHEAAAVLLGAFTLREHSGDFFEIRSPLCRITTHLALARYLSGSDALGINGRMAGVMLQTLMNNEAAALGELSGIKTNDAALTSWSRALKAFNTGDYRPLDQLNGLSPLECIAWFYASDRSANSDVAWSKLSDSQKHTADFSRIANVNDYSVGMGHDLLAVSLPAEFKEIASVYQLSHQKQLRNDGLVPALNEMPEGCLSAGSNDKPTVHVIAWGLWAGFFQRQLCLAVQQNFDLLERKWGVQDEAMEFSIKYDKLLGGLRLYPFVRRFNCTNVASFHQSVDDALKVTVATPQLVPAECWNTICYDFEGQSYRPNSNPHVNEWHNHNPPPGTAYDIYARLDHPSLTRRSDSGTIMDQLHERAPYDWNITYGIYATKYGKHPTQQQAEALFSNVLAYSDVAMLDMATTVRDQPEKYEALMTRAAASNPSWYFTLATYFENLKQDDKAAAYIEKGNAQDPDSVAASYHASWLVAYYLKKGNVTAARKEADFAGDVYSSVGLQAKAEFLEATGDYRGAFEWYSKIEERYDESGPVTGFCLRYRAKTLDAEFDGALAKRLGKLFPQGVETAKIDDFQTPPKDGVSFAEGNFLMKAAGLDKDDVIVAVAGIRVHDMKQYEYGRESDLNPELHLIVWKMKEQQYREIKASPPRHRFGVNLLTYSKK